MRAATEVLMEADVFSHDCADIVVDFDISGQWGNRVSIEPHYSRLSTLRDLGQLSHI